VRYGDCYRRIDPRYAATTYVQRERALEDRCCETFERDPGGTAEFDCQLLYNLCVTNLWKFSAQRAAPRVASPCSRQTLTFDVSSVDLDLFHQRTSLNFAKLLIGDPACSRLKIL